MIPVWKDNKSSIDFKEVIPKDAETFAYKVHYCLPMVQYPEKLKEMYIHSRGGLHDSYAERCLNCFYQYAISIGYPPKEDK